MTMHTKHTPWKAVEVYVNNAPNQWHVTTGKWGAQSIAVCDTAEQAHLIAAAPDLLPTLRHIEDLAGENAKGQDGYELIHEWAHKAIAKAEGRG